MVHFSNMAFRGLFTALAFLSFAPIALEAQTSIPIIGADESLSQYSCLTTPGVKTFGMKVVQANGTVNNITVKSAKSQVEKQIVGTTKKILNIQGLIATADTQAKRQKLKDKIKTLKSQRESLKYLKGQIALCEKAELQFSAANEPVLLTNIMTVPDGRQVTVYILGFKFTAPKNYSENVYCVEVSGAPATHPVLGGAVYPPGEEVMASGANRCVEYGPPAGNVCFSGLGDDDAMILLVTGVVVEKDGNCSSITACPLSKLQSELSDFYGNARLASLRPGRCDDE